MSRVIVRWRFPDGGFADLPLDEVMQRIHGEGKALGRIGVAAKGGQARAQKLRTAHATHWTDDLFAKAYAKLEADDLKRIGPDRLAQVARQAVAFTPNEAGKAEITRHRAISWLKSKKS